MKKCIMPYKKNYGESSPSQPDKNTRYSNYSNQKSHNYRVRSPVKSFRDLEVYQRTIQLSNEITNLEFLKSKEQFQKDNEEIKQLAESIPKLIAESYGDKFDSKELAGKKITEAVTLITNIITKIDLLREHHKNSQENKEILDKLLTNYQNQKLKTLNLRKAWQRIAEFDKIRFKDKSEGKNKE